MVTILAKAPCPRLKIEKEQLNCNGPAMECEKGRIFGHHEKDEKADDPKAYRETN